MAADSVSIEQVGEQLRTGLVEATASCRDNAATMLASGQAMINGCQTLNAVLLAFVQSRAKESLETSRRLAECGSPQSALEIQLDFAREALQAYGDHFTRCGAVLGETLNACVAPWQPRAGVPARSAHDLAA